MDTRLDQASRLIEIERAQIGHEIHDALLPLIFAASASIGSLIEQAGEIEESSEDSGGPSDSARAQQRLVQVASWLDDAMQTGRRLLSGVYPPELESAGWTENAASCVERLFAEQASMINWQLDPQINSVEPNVALAAYRIVVEAIRNAIRHGHATDIQVRTAKDADEGWSIEVVDNGAGFDSSVIPEDRFGIRSMIGRAELVDGSLKIDSTHGGPTTITFVLPQSL